MGNRFVRENLWMRLILLGYVFSILIYFVLSYRRELKPAFTEWMRGLIRRYHPDTLFPGEEGYEEALDQYRQRKAEKKRTATASSTPSGEHKEKEESKEGKVISISDDDDTAKKDSE
ncbi:hypothetical protein [Paraflavisolibacter sp. H34]|uniref:hypothetical protein n=1 Tax=Huijunlia imazamoxiresistens TaxID=3127457 RepID=UPI003016AD77